MSDISIIDPNFKVQTKLNESDIKFYNVLNTPFQIYGVFYENGKFRRLPENVAKTVSEGVCKLHTHTAGGRVRFKTDSPYVAIHTKTSGIGKMPHFALTGSAGFDLYADNNYVSTFIVPFDINDGYESIIHFPSKELREITINFPLYSSVNEMFVGISDQAELCAPEPYSLNEPIVYYGSSITQGGCASRPGMAYESIISRRLNADHINLGFSGNAKGEPEMAEYISRLDMAAFVYDYDYNAPSVEHLQNTHENMFRIIRNAHPQLPIVLMSRPRVKLTEAEQQRLEIIRATYAHAKDAGDENVYLLEGAKLMALCGDEGTVDGCHPTDFGFASMAKVVGDVLETILN